MYSGGSPSRLRQSRKDACPTRMTFNPHGPGAIIPHDVRKSTASLSEELRRPVPTLCPLFQRKKEQGKKKNAETEPHRKSSRICGKGVGEIYILFCFMFFFSLVFWEVKKKKAEFEISLIRQLYSESSSQIMIPVLHNCWKKSSFALPESRYNKMMLVPCFYSYAHTILRLRLHLEVSLFK